MENTAAIHVGRLLELRIAAGYRTAADVEALFDAIDVALSKLPASTRVVIAADWRRCRLMSSKTVELVLRRMSRNNQRTDRSAVLASHDSPTAVMQFFRVVRESNHPNRRLFFDHQDMTAWLDEVLSPQESARLHEFLLEPTV